MRVGKYDFIKQSINDKSYLFGNKAQIAQIATNSLYLVKNGPIHIEILNNLWMNSLFSFRTPTVI